MEVLDIQGKKYPGFGRCIYCGSNESDLRDEHIMPYCLGGNAILEAASCQRCEKITSYLDGYLGQKTFYEFRVHSGIQTRRPNKRPATLLATIQVRGELEQRFYPAKEHPY